MGQEQNKGMEQYRKFDYLLAEIAQNQEKYNEDGGFVSDGKVEMYNIKGQIGANVHFDGLHSVKQNAETCWEKTRISLSERVNVFKPNQVLCYVENDVRAEYSDEAQVEKHVSRTIKVLTPEYNPNDTAMVVSNYGSEVEKLQIMHTTQEDPDVFVNHVFHEIEQSKNKMTVSKKLNKLNLAPKSQDSHVEM